MISDRLECLKNMLADVEIHGVSSQTHVNVSGSPGAIVNTGSVTGGIHQEIGSIRIGGSEEIASLLEKLLDAVNVPDDRETTALLVQQVQALTHEAAKPKESRNSRIMAAAWGYIGNFSNIATIAGFLSDHSERLVALLHLAT